MSFNKLGRNILRLLDSVNTGLLTVNKILISSHEFEGVNNTNILIDEIKRKNKLKKNFELKNSQDDIKINIDDNTIRTQENNKIIAGNNLKSSIKNAHNIQDSEVDKNKKEIEKKSNGVIFVKELDSKLNLDNNKNHNYNLTDSLIEEISNTDTNQKSFDDPYLIKSDKSKFVGKASRIPVTSFSRAMNFTLLGASLFTNTLSTMMKDKVVSGLNEEKTFSSYLVNETNAERLSRTLCKMRGAALKFGQILSTFEDIIIPEPIRSALEKARAEADIMPTSQLLKILKAEYGKNWKEKFLEFNEEPFAAASIGQVHLAKILDSRKVAVKVQYPGVAQSIDSDLQNLKRVFEYFKIFPKGMYIDDLIKNIGNELRMECDYRQEAEKQIKFKNLLSDDPFFYIPNVIKDYSTNLILCSEFVEGVNVDEITNYSQDVRDIVGSKILELTLRELFEFKFMQTDPNPANFFYDHNKSRLNLIDFGAARSFDDSFVDKYMKIVHAASIDDLDTIIKMSKEIGFLTGMESKIMLDSHCQATLAVGEPFNIRNENVFDFGNQNLTRRIYKLIPTMLKHRLKAPPTEVYSLHRKLSGAFLICIKLKSRVESKKIFADIYNKFS